jgi:hypothetical protein
LGQPKILRRVDIQLLVLGGEKGTRVIAEKISGGQEGVDAGDKVSAVVAQGLGQVRPGDGIGPDTVASPAVADGPAHCGGIPGRRR